MNSLVKLVVALAFAVGVGCGGNDGDQPDAAIVDVEPPAKKDAGGVGSDAEPLAAVSGCAVGATPKECHLYLINSPAETTVAGQDVPPPVPPAYLTCIAQ